jgi:hypothetical protein
MLARRPLVVKCASHNERQVFQVYPPKHHVSLRDVEETMIATTNLSVGDKREVFLSVGIDYDRVEKYYGQVKYLEAIWGKYHAPVFERPTFFAKCIWYLLIALVSVMMRR